MLLDGENRGLVRTIEDWVEVCAGLDVLDLAESVAHGFLVCRPSSVLHVPDGPRATLRVDLRLMRAAKEGRFAVACPAWPLRRRGDSVYSFISVGRTGNCDVVIPDESISKLHALIKERRGAYNVTDAGSRNQTFVDGAAAPRRGEGEPLPIAPGSEVRFGSVDTVFFPAAEFKDLVAKVHAGPD